MLYVAVESGGSGAGAVSVVNGVRFVPFQVRRKNKGAPNLGQSMLGSCRRGLRQAAHCQHRDVIFLPEFPGRIGYIKRRLIAQVMHAVEAE